MSMTLADLADRIGARIEGEATAMVHGCAPIQSAGPNDVTFVANQRYAQFLKDTKAAAVLIASGMPSPPHLTRLVCDDPYYAFRNTLVELHGFREHPEPMDAGPDERISQRASIHREADLGDDVVVHPNVVIEKGATVGNRTVLYPGVYIGPDAQIGDDCIIHANVVVYDRCIIGNRVILHAGNVIGQDGFGFATHGGVHHKIPQTGHVVIEDDVELGACCAIERAAMGETRIGAGTKFADLISIGHGTTIGKHCLLVSLVGVSGSVEMGDYVVLGGQVGVTGHLKIGDGVQAAGKTAIASDIPPGSKIGGIPAVDIDTARRNALAGRELYKLMQRVRRLEKQLARAEQEAGASSPE